MLVLEPSVWMMWYAPPRPQLMLPWVAKFIPPPKLKPRLLSELSASPDGLSSFAPTLYTPAPNFTYGVALPLVGKRMTAKPVPWIALNDIDSPGPSRASMSSETPHEW